MNSGFWQLHYRCFTVAAEEETIVSPVRWQRFIPRLMPNCESCWKGRKTMVFTQMDEHWYVHGFLYSVRFLWCVGRREDVLVTKSQLVLDELLKPTRSSGPLSLSSSAVTLSGLLISRASRGVGFTFPCCQSSLLLLLLLQLLDGVHLSPGAHLAHRSRVLALHHQLVGHLVVSLQRPGEKWKPTILDKLHKWKNRRRRTSNQVFEWRWRFLGNITFQY